MEGPPGALVRGLVDGPSRVAAVAWHPEVTSTNDVAAAAAAQGVPEIHVVVADVQTAGRGRLGRVWSAPPGTSLLTSLVLRPGAAVAADQRPTIGLVAGVVLAEVAERYLAGRAAVALKWPNDLLLDGRKAAGILVEAAVAPGGHPLRPPGDAVIVGIGVNVDWRGVDRPPELAAATSLAEGAAAPIDRWRILAAVLGVWSNRYGDWLASGGSVPAGYRERCATIGSGVRVTRVGQPDLVGVATGVDADGALRISDEMGSETVVRAGDVEHARLVSDESG